MVCAIGRKIFALEHVDLAAGQADRVRRESELEVDVRELFGVLSLPGCPSAVAESLTLRFGPERPARRTIPRRVHEDQSRQKSDHDRKCVRINYRARERARGEKSSVLLLDFSEHAALDASGIRDAASTLAPIARANVDRLRLAFSSGCVQAKRFQSPRRDRVLGYDQQTGLARLRVEPARNRLARVSTGAVFVAGVDTRSLGSILFARDGLMPIAENAQRPTFNAEVRNVICIVFAESER